jgi:hypothetical protein
MFTQEKKALKIKKLPFNFSSLCLGASLLAFSIIGFPSSPDQAQAVQKIIRPSTATVKRMVNGDISCYIDLVDAKGRSYKEVPGSFDICAKKKTYLNKKVKLTYDKQKVSACQSNEPCGKSKVVVLITGMSIVR